MARIRWFDEGVRANIDRIHRFVYLSSGQESIAASIAEAFKDILPYVFCQHRGHAAYIAFGGNLEKLRDELLGLPTGCCGGKGGDPMIHDPNINFMGHSGLVADQVPIAVGMAFATKHPTICFFGDSTVEEDVFWPAVGFAATHNLPVLFVCEDNGLSVITQTHKRRSWNPVNVARGYGIANFEITDSPEQIHEVACAFRDFPTPTFLQVQCCRKYWHVGVGQDGPMAWDRLELTRGPGRELIELAAMDEMVKLWGQAA